MYLRRYADLVPPSHGTVPSWYCPVVLSRSIPGRLLCHPHQMAWMPAQDVSLMTDLLSGGFCPGAASFSPERWVELWMAKLKRATNTLRDHHPPQPGLGYHT
jgi:hypothetical protein